MHLKHLHRLPPFTQEQQKEWDAMMQRKIELQKSKVQCLVCDRMLSRKFLKTHTHRQHPDHAQQYMRALGAKLVNHESLLQTIGSRVKTAAEIAGAAQTAISAGRAAAPYIMQALRIGRALF